MPKYVTVKKPDSYIICLDSQDHVSPPRYLGSIFEWRVYHIWPWIKNFVPYCWRIKRVVSAIPGSTGKCVPSEHVEVVAMLTTLQFLYPLLGAIIFDRESSRKGTYQVEGMPLVVSIINNDIHPL
jgi:hypothetical protein